MQNRSLPPNIVAGRRPLSAITPLERAEQCHFWDVVNWSGRSRVIVCGATRTQAMAENHLVIYDRYGPDRSLRLVHRADCAAAVCRWLRQAGAERQTADDAVNSPAAGQSAATPGRVGCGRPLRRNVWPGS